MPTHHDMGSPDRMTAICRALAIASHGCPDAAAEGAISIFERLLLQNLPNHASLPLDSIIHALNVENGVLGATSVIVGDRAFLRFTGPERTWVANQASTMRKKLFVNVLERVMTSMRFERHEIVPCKMKRGNGLWKDIEAIDPEACNVSTEVLCY